MVTSSSTVIDSRPYTLVIVRRSTRFSPRYSNWQTSRARSAMDTKRNGPFFTSMALRPWARPS
ncbi:MAG: hypothetical protein ACLVI6_09395 [Bifidobacterium bifidum]|nr:hypothetical protein [Bifidobacterium longum]